MARRFSFLWRTGVAIAVISTLFPYTTLFRSLPEIEKTNPEFTFIRVDRDQYMDLAKLWDVYGIPSLVVLEKDKEIGRFVNRDRKSKQQINDFLAGLK